MLFDFTEMLALEVGLSRYTPDQTVLLSGSPLNPHYLSGWLLDSVTMEGRQWLMVLKTGCPQEQLEVKDFQQKLTSFTII